MWINDIIKPDLVTQISELQALRTILKNPSLFMLFKITLVTQISEFLHAPETIKKSIPKTKRKEKEKTSLSISDFTSGDAKKLKKEVSSKITSE